MARLEVNETTKTEDLLALRSPKPFMVQLAQILWGKSNQLSHAFIQFDSESLATVIDAKRQGVWDFGDHIKPMENGKGYTYPDKQAALRMIEEAAQSSESDSQPADTLSVEPTEDTESGSLITRESRRAELEAMNKRPLQQLHLAVTGNRSKRGEAAEHLIERILNVEFAEDATEEAIANATTSKLENAMAEDPQVREEPFDPRPAGPEVIVNTFSAKEEEEKYQAEQKDNLVEADFTQEEEAPIPDEYAYDPFERIISGMMGMFAMLDVVQKRQDVLAHHILEHGVQNRNWPRMPREIERDFDILSGNEQESNLPPIEVEEDVDTEYFEAAEEPPTNGGSQLYAENDLRRMTLKDLQTYADSIGVPDAHAQSMQPILLRQVLQQQKKMHTV